MATVCLVLTSVCRKLRDSTVWRFQDRIDPLNNSWCCECNALVYAFAQGKPMVVAIVKGYKQMNMMS